MHTVQNSAPFQYMAAINDFEGSLILGPPLGELGVKF